MRGKGAGHFLYLALREEPSAAAAAAQGGSCGQAPRPSAFPSGSAASPAGSPPSGQSVHHYRVTADAIFPVVRTHSQNEQGPASSSRKALYVCADMGC